MLTRNRVDWWLLAALVCVWGSSFALTKIAVTEVSPQWVVALRLAIGALLLGAVALMRGAHLAMTPSIVAWYVWLGVIGNFTPFLLISWGTQFIPSSVAGILMATVPLAVVLLAHVFLPDERMTMGKALGFTVGFAGAIVLIGPKALLQLVDGDLSLVAKLTISAATICYAVNGVSARRMPPISAMARAVGSLAAAAIMAVPFAAVMTPDGLHTVSWGAALAIIALGIFPTAIANLLLFKLLERAGASFVSYSNYLVPVFAILVGVVFLDERLGVQTWIGTAIILAGILITNKGGAKHTRGGDQA